MHSGRNGVCFGLGRKSLKARVRLDHPLVRMRGPLIEALYVFKVWHSKRFLVKAVKSFGARSRHRSSIWADVNRPIHNFRVRVFRGIAHLNGKDS